MRLQAGLLGLVLIAAGSAALLPLRAQEAGGQDYTAEGCSIAVCAQIAAQAALDAQAALTLLVPAHAVMAFNLQACPQGWSRYVPAEGRFIRGLEFEDRPGLHDDPDWASRTPGNIQQDAFQGHGHRTERAGLPGPRQGDMGNSGPEATSFVWNGQYEPQIMILAPTELPGGEAVRVAGETRPDNVALLYCERDGVAEGSSP